MRIYGWFGLLLLIASEYCLFHKIEPFVTWFYCFAWWAYILLADNLLFKLRGKSLLTGRLREFWAMLPLSIFIWLVFEAFNFRIRNWSYIVGPMETWKRWLGYAAAYSTVLPGIFITSDLVEWVLGNKSMPAASQHEALSPSPHSISPSLSIVAGLVLTAAPLIWPRYFFAAVWLGPIFLLDPLLEKIGIQSLSLGLQSGKRTRVWSLMSGGLLCGFIWEFWNYWAGSKWIYTVPYFGNWKVFEMPALGFLGFPPFALECWVLYHLLKAIPGHMDSTAARIAWWVGLAILSVFIMRAVDTHTVV
jgi:hypothetical protein